MSSRKRHKGKLVIVDGIDGSGKGTLISALEAWARAKGMKVFNVVEYEKKHHDLPEMKHLKDAKVIVSAEPTHSLVGKAIREEIVRRNARGYSPEALAQSYALDRNILYERIHIPALGAGKYIFQERGVTSSLVYQPLYSKKLHVPYIMGIAGNKLALEHPPDLLCILKVDPRKALRRLRQRSKQDRAIFENAAFLAKVQKRFLSQDFRKIFARRGTRVEILDTEGSLAETTRQMVDLWEQFLAMK